MATALCVVFRYERKLLGTSTTSGSIDGCFQTAEVPLSFIYLMFTLTNKLTQVRRILEPDPPLPTCIQTVAHQC